ncbi:MAG TPA: BamA/TamA family outer membrane protein [Vicinamibacterales bacterium]
MTAAVGLIALVLACAGAPDAAVQQAPPAASSPVSSGTVVAIRVHGNHTTPDREVLRLAGVEPGRPFDAGLPAAVEQRLEASGRFRSVEVRTRFASLSDPTAYLLVIVVEEQAGISVDVPDPGPMRRLRANTMWIPILSREEGYGFTYGVRVSFVDVAGPRTRLSVPLTWGGERQAAVELERRFDRGPLTRIAGRAGVTRREHPTLEIGNRRTGVSARAERALTSWMHVAATAGLHDVQFGTDDERLGTFGAEAVVDTRRDPAFPRNAVFASAAIERLDFRQPPDAVRVSLDGRAYVGLVRQLVLAVHGLHIRTSEPVPVFEQALLGGTRLRGFGTGYRQDDRLAAASVEIRAPFSSPLSHTRAGVAVFADTGTVWSATDRLRGSRWDTGVGAGLFLRGPLFGLRVDVARGLDYGTRAHVTLGATF